MPRRMDPETPSSAPCTTRYVEFVADNPEIGPACHKVPHRLTVGHGLPIMTGVYHTELTRRVNDPRAR